jgi:hypothetical protein
VIAREGLFFFDTSSSGKSFFSKGDYRNIIADLIDDVHVVVSRINHSSSGSDTDPQDRGDFVRPTFDHG